MRIVANQPQNETLTLARQKLPNVVPGRPFNRKVALPVALSRFVESRVSIASLRNVVMSQDVRVYAGLIEAARGGSEGAQTALRQFLRDCSATLPADVLLRISDLILESMREQVRGDVRRN